MLRVYCSLFVGAVLAVTAGCGGSSLGTPVPVTGKIIYQGQPVEGAQVTFHAKADTGEEGAVRRSANGRTTADGTFSLTTFKTGDGALPGDYVITVSKIEGSAASGPTEIGEGDYGAMMDAAAKGVDVTQSKDNKLPPKYAKANDSGIERSVSKDPPNDFEIVLE